MIKTTSAVKAFIATYDNEPLTDKDLDGAVEAIVCSTPFRHLLLSLIDSDVFSPQFGEEFAQAGAIKSLAAWANSSPN